MPGPLRKIRKRMQYSPRAEHPCMHATFTWRIAPASTANTEVGCVLGIRTDKRAWRRSMAISAWHVDPRSKGPPESALLQGRSRDGHPSLLTAKQESRYEEQSQRHRRGYAAPLVR